jgi:hypothetical protein
LIVKARGKNATANREKYATGPNIMVGIVNVRLNNAKMPKKGREVGGYIKPGSG